MTFTAGFGVYRNISNKKNIDKNHFHFGTTVNPFLRLQYNIKLLNNVFLFPCSGVQNKSTKLIYSINEPNLPISGSESYVENFTSPFLGLGIQYLTANFRRTFMIETTPYINWNTLSSISYKGTNSPKSQPSLDTLFYSNSISHNLGQSQLGVGLILSVGTYLIQERGITLTFTSDLQLSSISKHSTKYHSNWEYKGVQYSHSAIWKPKPFSIGVAVGKSINTR